MLKKNLHWVSMNGQYNFEKESYEYNCRTEEDSDGNERKNVTLAIIMEETITTQVLKKCTK